MICIRLILASGSTALVSCFDRSLLFTGRFRGLLAFAVGSLSCTTISVHTTGTLLLHSVFCCLTFRRGISSLELELEELELELEPLTDELSMSTGGTYFGLGTAITSRLGVGGSSLKSGRRGLLSSISSIPLALRFFPLELDFAAEGSSSWKLGIFIPFNKFVLLCSTCLSVSCFDREDECSMLYNEEHLF